MALSLSTRRGLQLALGCWLPFLACAVADRAAGAGIEPAVRDPAVHARLLIAVPLFVIGDVLLRGRIDDVLARLVGEQIVADKRRLESLARGVDHFLGGRALCVTMFAIAVAVGQIGYWRHGPGHGPAAIWYGWLAHPVFVFFTLRLCTRWLAWAWTLWRISRMPLATEATHPDRAGGLSFLARPLEAFVLLVLGFAAVIATTFAPQFASGEAHIKALLEPVALWAEIALAVALSPYLVFTRVLVRARWKALAEYDRLALIYSRRFHGRWIEREPGPELLGSSDIQSLNDLAGPYGVVRRMRPVLFDLRQLLPVLVAVVLPFAPLLLFAVPLPTMLARAAQNAIGL